MNYQNIPFKGISLVHPRIPGSKFAALCSEQGTLGHTVGTNSIGEVR